MDTAAVEELLREDESASLDFKRDQYLFVGASDDDKSELLKDILAFANAWRRSDAVILIGVDEAKGARSVPVGVTEHLDDAQLQQFVNSKTQRPVTFEYRRVTVDGFEVGAILIPVQPRPTFLTKNYGKLKKDVVYVRRGSSTAVADLDEVLKMQAATQPAEASLSLVIRKNDNESRDFVIGIRNAEDAAPAHAPYFEVDVSPPFGVAQYGLDGWGRDGLPEVAQSGRDSRVRKFRGDTTTVIHPGVTLDVTRVKCKDGPLPDALELTCAIAAANAGLKKETARIQLPA